MITQKSLEHAISYVLNFKEDDKYQLFIDYMSKTGS